MITLYMIVKVLTPKLYNIAHVLQFFFISQRGELPLYGWSYFELIVMVLNLAFTCKHYKIKFILEKMKLSKKKKDQQSGTYICNWTTRLWHNAL